MNTAMTQSWQPVCNVNDLVPHSGVAALVEQQQVALFYLPGETTEVYALSNRDPVSGANVMARGIIGDQQGEPMVASPLYKQHYRLKDGHCLDEQELKLQSWPVRINEGQVELGWY